MHAAKAAAGQSILEKPMTNSKKPPSGFALCNSHWSV